MAPNDPTPPADNDSTTKPKKPKKARFAEARAWWTEAWEKGGTLHEMWEDVRSAPDAGWHGMANWIKAIAAIAVFSFVILLFNGAVDVLLNATHHILTAVPNVQVGDNTSTGVWATIDNPVRSYIAAHSAGLPISASTVYTLWQVTGLFSLIAGFITRSNGIRLTWSCWGFAGIAMVWTTTPDASRTVATAIAVLAWTGASAFAMRGLNLRPRVFAHVTTGAPQITVQPQIHIPAQPDGGTPDNVRQLGR
ncbi:hypothetical protein AMK09_37685 [Streptomyces sp. CB02488]|uniref:hypothetical protein n=1 Tax=Streptomyces sp. CB02488 TaxID=1703920 RepID=UPI00093A651B|nr:hypothetical protein [Streptomyces sp. CB02488]OKK05285.1 hypothetical protein AMK09_37685 [Streptomyces sp. CB02488]